VVRSALKSATSRPMTRERHTDKGKEMGFLQHVVLRDKAAWLRGGAGRTQKLYATDRLKLANDVTLTTALTDGKGFIRGGVVKDAIIEHIYLNNLTQYKSDLAEWEPPVFQTILNRERAKWDVFAKHLESMPWAAKMPEMVDLVGNVAFPVEELTESYIDACAHMVSTYSIKRSSTPPRARALTRGKKATR